MKKLLILVALTSISSCALTPYPTSGDEKEFTVHQPYIGKFDKDKAMLAAEKHCKQYGKQARVKSDKGTKILYECYKQ